jgi:hypothetical protein
MFVKKTADQSSYSLASRSSMKKSFSREKSIRESDETAANERIELLENKNNYLQVDQLKVPSVKNELHQNLSNKV